jgi:hypothetical protein
MMMQAASMKVAKPLVVIVAAVVIWAALTGRLVMIFAEVAYLSSFFHRSVTYEIVEPYQGWVLITYRRPECKPLEIRGFSLVVHVDNSGRGCTSDPNPLESWRRTEYVYVAENGSKTLISPDMISAIAAGSSDATHPYEDEHFFVGSREALKNAWSKEPR